MTTYADESALGSTIIAGVAAELDSNEQVATVAIVVDRNYTPPRLLIELPDRALRDLGVVTVDGAIGAEVAVVAVAGTSYTVKHAAIEATAGGNTEVVAAVTGKKIRVLNVLFTCSADVAVGWQSAANALVGAMSFAAKGGMAYEPRSGWFCETNAAEALNINLSGTANVRGVVNYVEV